MTKRLEVVCVVRTAASIAALLVSSLVLTASSPARQEQYFTLPAYLRIVNEFRVRPSSELVEQFSSYDEVWRIDALREMRAAVRQREIRAEEAAQAAALLHLEVFVRGRGLPSVQNFHLEAGLQLLSDADAIIPREFQRRCHLLVIWSLQRTFDVEALAPRLDTAMRRFGVDSDFLLAQGSLFELLASRPDSEIEPLRVPDNAVVTELTKRSGSSSNRLAIVVERPAIYLSCAKLYERALVLSPTQHEARVRLAKVLLDAGKFREALRDLNALPASAEGMESRILYLAALFRGRSLVALGQAADAEKPFRAAHSLFPGCHTPLIALSQSMRATGQVVASHDLIMQVTTGTGLDSCYEDPWASYPAGQAWRIPSLLNQLERELTR